jgi:hypothetical protein
MQAMPSRIDNGGLQSLLQSLLQEFAGLASRPSAGEASASLGLDCHAPLPGGAALLSLSCGPTLAAALALGAGSPAAAGLEQDALEEFCNICCSRLSAKTGQARGFLPFLPEPGPGPRGQLLALASLRTELGPLCAGLWSPA